MNKKSPILFPAIGFLAGIAAIIFGIVVLGQGNTASSASFGADFYTYSYKATRYAANNILVVSKALGYLLVSFGLFDIAFFGDRFSSLLTDRQATPTPATEVTAAPVDAAPEEQQESF